MHLTLDIMTYVTLQVAFGTDFSQDQYVLSVAGEKGLLYLLSHSFEGVMKQMMNPTMKVCDSEIQVDVFIHFDTLRLSSIPPFPSLLPPSSLSCTCICVYST